MPASPLLSSTPAGVQHLDGQSKYYLVVITSSRWGDVYAWLPEETQMLVRSSWAPVTGNVVSSLINFATIAATSLGTNTPFTLFSKRLTAQEWQGSEPLDLQLQLHFFATIDAGLEVIEPIKRLIKMALPMKRSQGFGGGQASDAFLIAPGPVPRMFGDDSEARSDIAADDINVYLGNFCRLQHVFLSVIQSIDFMGKLSVDGIPMEAKCNVVFRTLFSPIADDIDNYFSAPSIGQEFGAPHYPSE